jgi:flagellar hook-associated protein FlgK
MSNLIMYEQAYSAAARLITVIQKMFDALDRAMG